MKVQRMGVHDISKSTNQASVNVVTDVIESSVKVLQYGESTPELRIK